MLRHLKTEAKAEVDGTAGKVVRKNGKLTKGQRKEQKAGREKAGERGAEVGREAEGGVD